MRTLRAIAMLLLIATVLLGGVYPAIVTGFAQTFFPAQAAGSLIRLEDRTVGSRLIGQPFTSPQYFWGRPSATGERPYNPAASGASNLGAGNPVLLERIAERAAALRKGHPNPEAPIPVDLVTASGSGLDPHISLAAAEYQVPRVAKARKIAEDEVRLLVQAHTTGRFLGVFGEPVVHVLGLNMALDQQSRKQEARR